MFVTLSQWLTYLEGLHPNEIELGLDRILVVANKLRLDFSQQKIVTVGGTNGKGSTISLLTSILQSAGYKVGAYTSPHLLVYNERVCINGINADDDSLCEAFSKVENARGDVQLTYFEFGTLAALVLFGEQALDFVLLEVGLGGRLDAVNILDADLSIITNVALDHTDWLGETREAIGTEKAGIYRANRPALYGELLMPDSVAKHIEKVTAELYWHGRDYHYSISADNKSWSWQGLDNSGNNLSLDNLPLDDFSLNYALDNAALVLQAISLLNVDISYQQINRGLCNATLSGRFQEFNRGHSVILDVAHNPHAIKNLVKNLQASFPQRRLNVVIAMLKDKDINKVLELLYPLVDNWYIGEIHESRGCSAKSLEKMLKHLGDTSLQCFSSITDAFNSAENNVAAEDVVLVTGSFYTVSEVLELL